MKSIKFYIGILFIVTACAQPLEMEMSSNLSDKDLSAKLAYEAYLEDFKVTGKKTFRTNNYSSHQKYQVWIGHFNSLNNSLNLNQQALINQLKLQLHPNLFKEDNHQELLVFEEFYLGQWLDNVKLNFSREEIDLVFNLPKPVGFTKIDDLQTVITEGECEWLKSSIFDSCEWNNLTTCKTSSNCEQVSGCGFMGFYKCTGICKLIQPE